MGIQDWIAKSGVWVDKWQSQQKSNDKLSYNYGLPQLDDHSIRKAVYDVAPWGERHYVVMEVKENLTASDRKVNLKRFNLPHFKKIAAVVMGEPNAEYKSKVHEKLLQDKERKKAEKKKQKELAEKKKAQAEAIAKRKEEIKKRQEEIAAKKKAEADAKKKAEDDKKKEGESAEKKEGDAAE